MLTSKSAREVTESTPKSAARAASMRMSSSDFAAPRRAMAAVRDTGTDTQLTNVVQTADLCDLGHVLGERVGRVDRVEEPGVSVECSWTHLVTSLPPFWRSTFPPPG
jgi:hypothetical protein